MKDLLLFAKTFLKNPANISSVMPTAPWAAKSIAGRIRKKAGVVVEYGPGTGAVSRQILRSPWFDEDSKLILIERQKEFADRLKKAFQRPDVVVCNDSAEEIERILIELGIEEVDHIFSSIPMTIIPRSSVDAILEATSRVLARDGKLVVFQCRLRVGEILREHFADMRLTSVELLNLPPLLVYEATAEEGLDTGIIEVRTSG